MILSRSSLSEFAASAIMVAASLGIAAIPIYLVGINPASAYGLILVGAFGDTYRVAEVLVKSTPLIITALGFAFALRAGIWNIGCEGQIIMGSIGASVAALFLILPAGIHPFTSILVGAIFGASWSAIPGALRVKFGANELLTTLMMNYIAFWILHYLTHFSLRSPDTVVPRTSDFPASALLPKLLPGTPLHIGILMAIGCGILVYFVLSKTTLGYTMRAVGENVNAAKSGGIYVTRTVLLSMAISGGLAGLAGAGEVLGVYGLLQEGQTVWYGYTAITIALMARLSVVGIFPTAIFFGALLTGGTYMQAVTNLPVELTFFIQGVAIIAIIARIYITRRV